MIGWGEILTGEQIQQLVEFIRQLRSAQPATSEVSPTQTLTTETQPTEGVPTETPAPQELSFEKDILPIFDAQCNVCHGTSGGWNGTTYDNVMTTGDNKPVVVPGDVENSLLAHKLLGTQTEGSIMPPFVKLPEEDIQLILSWIEAGAPK